MALGAIVRKFTIDLAHVDRGIYETLEFKLAQHPSENANRVVVRVLARALAYEEGLEFGRGLSNVEEPALWSKDARGQIRLWIDVGAPSAQRLHRASKQAHKIWIFTDKNTTGLKKEWGGQKIHRADDISLVLIPPSFTAALAESVCKQNHWTVTMTGGYLNVGYGDRSVDTQIEESTVGAFT
ncbi:MAG: YaeQ family protein [Myxococcota bacterium]|nr:YaeQ family protein [Myxococcota bacterium]